MPDLSLANLVELADLAAAAYLSDDGAPLSMRLPQNWTYLNPVQLGFVLIGPAEGGGSIYRLGGTSFRVDAQGYFNLGSNAAYVAYNSVRGELAVVFRGTELTDTDLATDAMIPIGELFDVIQAMRPLTDAAAVYANGHGLIPLAAGHSLGGALAEVLAATDGRFQGGLSMAGPGIAPLAALPGLPIVVPYNRDFFHVAHDRDFIGYDIFSQSHIGTEMALIDHSFLWSVGLLSHGKAGYLYDLHLLADSSTFGTVTPALLNGVTFADRTDFSFNGSITASGVRNFFGTPNSDRITAELSTLDLRIDGDAGYDYITGGNGNDGISGGADIDTIAGGAGNDILHGDGASDYLTGGMGNDMLIGGAGGDTYTVRLGEGQDVVDDQGGGDGPDFLAIYGGSVVPTADKLVYTVDGGDLRVTAKDAAGNVVIDVTIRNMGNPAGQIETLLLYGPGGALAAVIDLVKAWSQAPAYNLIQPPLNQSVTNIAGTSGRDLIYLDWSQLSTPVSHQAGNSNWGEAVYYSALGQVIVDYSMIEQVILVGGSANDHLSVLFFHLPANLDLSATIFGGEGNDTLQGGTGNDTLYGGAGHDYLSDLGGSDTFYGGDGNDAITTGYYSSAGGYPDLFNIAYGGPGDDSYVPGSGDTLIEYENEGVDTITLAAYAGPANGYLTYVIPENIENLYSSAPPSTFRVIYGNTAANVITMDIYTSGVTIYALEGNDTIRGIGNISYGGAGNDTYEILFPTDLANIHEIAGQGDADYVLINRASDDMYVMPDQVENMTFFQALLIPDQNFGPLIFRGTGNAQNNIIYGAYQDDVLYGMGGNDTLYGGKRNDYLNGGDGDDLLVGGGDSDVLIGGADFDTVDYSSAPGWVFINMAGQNGNEDAYGDTYSSIERIIGSAFGDTMNGDAAANVLEGRGGSDTLDGGAGADILIGGEGADILRADSGGDRLEGGAGADVFTFSPGEIHSYAKRSDGEKSILLDTIADFVSGTDKIDVSAFDGFTLSGGNDAFTYIGTGAFTHQAGQLRYEAVNGVTSIYGDANGDGIADLHIVALGMLTLTAADFVL